MEKKRNSSVRSGALIRFWVVIAAIIGIFLVSVGWLAGHIRQGLDLQGGTALLDVVILIASLVSYSKKKDKAAAEKKARIDEAYYTMWNDENK